MHPSPDNLSYSSYHLPLTDRYRRRLNRHIPDFPRYIFVSVHAIYFYQRENFLIQAEETDEDTNEKEYVMRWGK